MAKRTAECERCKKSIDLEEDFYVSLGTHKGKEVRDMKYFHFNCWRVHFEEKAREKAEAVVNGMQERIMPIAKQMTDKFKNLVVN